MNQQVLLFSFKKSQVSGQTVTITTQLCFNVKVRSCNSIYVDLIVKFFECVNLKTSVVNALLYHKIFQHQTAYELCNKAVKCERETKQLCVNSKVLPLKKTTLCSCEIWKQAVQLFRSELSSDFERKLES